MTYNGNVPDGELVVLHTSDTGNSMAIIVPIIESAPKTSASTVVQRIIGTVSKNAPSEGETTTIPSTMFNLTNVVPKQPYYSFRDPNVGDIVVFGAENAISINSSALNSLNSIITKSQFNVSREESLFFNKTGPNTNSANDGIYIDCQRTGDSSEEIDIVYKSLDDSGLTIDTETIKTYGIVLIIIISLIMIAKMIPKIIGFINEKMHEISR